VLDALHDVRDRLRFVICRHEGGAAYMGEAYGKLTGRPGVVLVTRGPGASNAAIGIHVAQQDSTPLIVLVGQVGTGMADREAFQEVDYRRMYGSIAKWSRRSTASSAFPNTSRRRTGRLSRGGPGPSCSRCRKTC
jgi:acetolactate synthase-1/2/3 large subunit